jgi:hypothetical protein
LARPRSVFGMKAGKSKCLDWISLKKGGYLFLCFVPRCQFSNASTNHVSYTQLWRLQGFRLNWLKHIVVMCFTGLSPTCQFSNKPTKLQASLKCDWTGKTNCGYLFNCFAL